jgi:hypothetical protein
VLDLTREFMQGWAIGGTMVCAVNIGLSVLSDIGTGRSAGKRRALALILLWIVIMVIAGEMGLGA